MSLLKLSLLVSKLIMICSSVSFLCFVSLKLSFKIYICMYIYIVSYMYIYMYVCMTRQTFNICLYFLLYVCFGFSMFVTFFYIVFLCCIFIVLSGIKNT